MDKIKVVMVEPDKPAYVTEISKDLKSLQSAVGGYIEIIPYLEDAEMIGNEEAKLIGMKGNRRFGERIVAGPFFICGTETTGDGEIFSSLSDELCEKYTKQFAVPEQISQDEVEADMKTIIISF